MSKLSTNQVAKKLGLTSASLTRYILAGKVSAPPETMAGGMRMRLWSESDIEGLKEALPKIANGRKTRYKKQSAGSNQQSAKTKKKTQARAPALQNRNNKKK
jgi:predicted DNA-binding transcriptional regulator AlpA